MIGLSVMVENTFQWCAGDNNLIAGDRDDRHSSRDCSFYKFSSAKGEKDNNSRGTESIKVWDFFPLKMGKTIFEALGHGQRKKLKTLEMKDITKGTLLSPGILWHCVLTITGWVELSNTG